jgi:hypothetical protein
MITLDGPDFYGYTIFCDDIRHEVGGKVSYIGVYRERLYVHGSFPFVVPKFGFGITCLQKARLFLPISKLVIFLPGDADDKPSIEAEGPPPGYERDAREAAEEDSSNPHGQIRVAANVVIGPVEISQPGFIKVRACRNNDELIRCGMLDIQQHPKVTAPQGAT